MEMLLAGEDYAELPNTYVIFICDFDPIGEGKYRYTLRLKINLLKTKAVAKVEVAFSGIPVNDLHHHRTGAGIFSDRQGIV